MRQTATWLLPLLTFLMGMMAMAVGQQQEEEEEDQDGAEEELAGLATPSPEPVEGSFTNTKEFRAIMGGVAGFWGGVFSMGSIYLMLVFAKRVFNPEEADEKGGD